MTIINHRRHLRRALTRRDNLTVDDVRAAGQIPQW